MMNHDDENKNYYEEEYEIMNIFDWEVDWVLFIEYSYYYNYRLSRDIYEDYMNLKMKSYNNYIMTKNVSRSQKWKLKFELKEQEKQVRFELYDR